MTEQFPEWKEIYKTQSVESMPWYNPNLDEDLDEELKKRNLKNGSILDIGSGPGTQTAQLCQRGFQATGADISDAAVEKAKENFPDVNFVVADILHSDMGAKYDFAFDRGCFHVFAPENRALYVARVAELLNPHGLLFLKAFSEKTPDWGYGPFRFNENEIREIFAPNFSLISTKETIFQGNMKTIPQALFCVLEKKD